MLGLEAENYGPGVKFFTFNGKKLVIEKIINLVQTESRGKNLNCILRFPFLVLARFLRFSPHTLLFPCPLSLGRDLNLN